MAKNILSAVAVRTKKAGRHNDGGGLYLVVTESGTRRWELLLMVNGKRRQLGLGVYPDVTLEHARQQADELRQRSKAEGRVVSKRETVEEVQAEEAKAAPPDATTVRQAFDAYFADKGPTLKTGKYAAQWRSSLETHAFGAIGDLDVAAVTTKQVAALLRPIWREKPVTARDIRQRLRVTFDWAIANDIRSAANPTLAVDQILPPQGHRAKHRRALPYAEVPALVQRLRTWRGFDGTKLGLEWLLLTATRSTETRLAEWSEVDVEARLWTVPEARMKMGETHVVPLSSRCIAIYAECRERWPDQPLIFKGNRQGRPLSENAFCNALAAMGYGEQAVAHGLRSSFRDWAAEVAQARHEVAETCLAHKIRDKTVAAYLRASFLAERRELMRRWADHCGG